MSPRLSAPFLVILAFLVAGCASATKRYEQGMELEMQGDYHAASARYVQALQKDPSLQEARSRLRQVGQRAVTEHLQDARSWQTRGAHVQAASEFRGLDGLVAQARSVGVRVELPADYHERRRESFDLAIESLLEQSALDASRGLWAEGMNAARHARTQYEPSTAQIDRAVAHESMNLLGWSEQELASGRLRAAYDRAAQVQELGAPIDDHRAAARIMGEALDRGQVELMILPLVVAPDDDRVRTRGNREARLEREARLRELETQVNAALASGPFLTPSPFVQLSDPIAVREVVRQAGVLEGGVRSSALGLLLRLVDGDYGAWLELASVETTEFEVKQTPRDVRTLDGEPASIVIEEGQRRATAEARVLVVDTYGNEIASVKVIGLATVAFRRGVYDGDPRELNLGRRDVDAFDVHAQDAAEQALHRALSADLANRLAAAVFDPVLARIP